MFFRKFSSFLVLVLVVNVVLGDKDPIGRPHGIYISSASSIEPTATKIANSPQPNSFSPSVKDSQQSDSPIRPHFASFETPSQSKTLGSFGSTGPAYNSPPSGGGGGWSDQPQQPQQGGYAPANQQPQYGQPAPPPEKDGPKYAYYYTHYPQNQDQNQGWSAGGHEEESGGFFGGGGGGSGGFGGFSDFTSGLQLPSFGGGGGGGAKSWLPLAALAKGILAIKPFILIGILLVVALPLMLLFMPIPIISVTSSGNTKSPIDKIISSSRSGKSNSSITSYISKLSEKVLSSEECLERIVCKLPQTPENYKGKAKMIWDEYAKDIVGKWSPRAARGLSAYFEGQVSKNRAAKCNEKFKCSYKYL